MYIFDLSLHEFVDLRYLRELPIFATDPSVLLALVVHDTAVLVHKPVVDHIPLISAKLAHDDDKTSLTICNVPIRALLLFPPHPFVFFDAMLEIYGCTCSQCRQRRRKTPLCQKIDTIMDYMGANS